MNPRPRVLLAEDHGLLLEAFQRLLEPACEVVGRAADGVSLLPLALRLRPDVIVLDIAMPGLNGIDAARQLRGTLPEAKLVFLTANEDPDLALAAFEAGASGYLLKHSASSELFTAIDAALQGGRYITPLLTRGAPVTEFLRRERSATPDRLTGRQREVVALLADGKTMKEVAELLRVTPRTVAFHKYAIMEQLGISTSAELVQYAVQHGLVRGRRG